MGQRDNLNNALPAAPSGLQNNKWAADAPSIDPAAPPRNISNYTPLATALLPGSVLPDGITVDLDPVTGKISIPIATTSSLGVVKVDGLSIVIDPVTGKISMTGMSFEGAWSASGLYTRGMVVIYNGLAYLNLLAINEATLPALVQARANSGSNSLAFASDVPAGNLLVVCVGGDGLSAAISAPTDTLGTVYSLIDTNGGPGIFANIGAMYAGVAPSSGPCTVTMPTWGGTPSVALSEFVNVNPILDAHTSGINILTAPLTTSHATMIICGLLEHGPGPRTYGGVGGLTIATSSGQAAIGYLSEGAAGTYTSGFTATSNANPVFLAGAFRDGALTPDVDTTHWFPLGQTIPIVIGFLMTSGVTGSAITPPGRLVAPRAATVSKCKVIVNASDAGTNLTFRIQQNGTDIFLSDPTITASTAPGTLLTFTNLTTSPLAIAADDIFTIDITSGTASWNFTAQLE